MSATDKFRNPDLKVKINPDTYIKFDGSDKVMLQNVGGEQGITIKYDILLILYDLVDWKSIGDLIEPWPFNDQEKIIEHLSMLSESKIILDSDSPEPVERSESGLSEFLGSKIHINVENHHNMLRDYVRMAAYRRAIERAITPETVAMDLGCGTGVLSFFAAEAGAQKIYAIERRPDIILLAQELAKANGYADQIQFIEKASTAVKENEIEPKVDVLISEILGNGILEENIIEFTLDARDRFLKPGGVLLPYQIDIYAFAYDCGLRQDKLNEVKEFKDLYGMDFELLGKVLGNKTVTHADRYNTYTNITMSDPYLVQTIDMRTLVKTFFQQAFEVEILEDGQITHFCAYFKAHLDEKTILTNSPWAPSTHWTQLIFNLPVTRKVAKGEKIKAEMLYDGGLRLYLVE